MKWLIRALGVSLVTAFAVAVLLGCGGGLSASSTCKDFANASPQEQAEAISKLSSQFDTPMVATPLGSPDVGFECASRPEMTLEELFKGYHENETGEATEEGLSSEAEAGGAGELSGTSEVEELLEGISQKGLVLGELGAPVELIEFADLQCPVCKAFAEEVLPPVIEGPIAEGKAKLVFRNYTIISQQSVPAGTAAIAAGRQGRGWNFLELFYRNQGEEASGYVTDDFLTEIAEAAGVPDIAQWDEDRMSSRTLEEVEGTTSEAQRLGCSGTPCFAVEGPGTSGKETLGTPGSAESLSRSIEEAG